MLFVMDPIGSIDIDKDTTFVLMLAAQERGHRVFYCELADLSVEEGKPVARAQPVALRREVGRHADLGASRTLSLDDDCDVVFQRKDPPVDVDYVTATQILALCRRALVLNRPDTVIWANEKLYAVQFPDLMPETRVSRRIPEFVDFLAKLGGEMIVKPLGGKGGEGVFHLRHDDRNLFSILEQVTGFGTRWAMAQRYVPEVRQGDKRILLVDGEPLGRRAARARRRARRAPTSTSAAPPPAPALDARRPPHRRSPPPPSPPRRPLLRRHRRHRRSPHRGERHQPDGHPGDQRPRRRPPRAPRDRGRRAPRGRPPGRRRSQLQPLSPRKIIDTHGERGHPARRRRAP